LNGSIKEPNISIYFFFQPITQWCSISNVLFTGGRRVLDFSVLKYYLLNINYSVNILNECLHVSKLSFASVRMCDCKRLSAHNFVDFCLQTTLITSEVLRCRSPSRCPPSNLTHQTLRRRDFVQSPFTDVEMDLSVGDDHHCCRKPHGSLRSFSLTGTIF